MDTKTRGNGPLLLLLHGGGGSADSYDAVLDILAERYTVVTYTQCDGGPAERADEAHHLLADLGATSVPVFASSAGAIVALDLAARHPEHVGLIIAHEPPLVTLLPDADEQIQTFRDMIGAPDNGELFLRHTGVLGNVGEAVLQAVATQIGITEEGLDFVGHRPDLDAVRAGGVPVVPVIGKAGEGSMCWHTTEALAARLGTGLVVMPGNHFGYAPLPGVNDPVAFARTLLDLLTSQLSR